MSGAARLLSLAVLVVVTAAAPPASAGGERLLFGTTPLPAAQSSPAALESWRAEVDVELLAAAPDRLELELPGRAAEWFRVSGVERRGVGDLAWRGRPEQGPGLAVLTLRGERAGGLVDLGEEVWELSPLPGGSHRLERLDQDLFPLCGEPLTGAGEPAPPAPWAPSSAARRPAELTTIDVLVTYTPQARDGAGGTGGIEFVAQSAVDVTNTAFAESQSDVRFRLVHIALSTRNDSGDYNADLAWLRSDPVTAALRDLHGADLVSLLVENAGGVCGVGYLGPGPNAVYQVTARACAVGNISWAHEHGHNLGMHHDPANASPPGALFRPWAYGHWVSTSPAPPGGNFRTVMSYSAECPFGCARVPRFSNPAVLYNGEPTGLDDGVCDPADWDPGNRNAWACRDNQRLAEETGPIIATYREPPLVFADGFESGTTGAWSFAVP
jgi:hypothetical protein